MIQVIIVTYTLTVEEPETIKPMATEQQMGSVNPKSAVKQVSTPLHSGKQLRLAPHQKSLPKFLRAQANMKPVARRYCQAVLTRYVFKNCSHPAGWNSNDEGDFSASNFCYNHRTEDPTYRIKFKLPEKTPEEFLEQKKKKMNKIFLSFCS